MMDSMKSQQRYILFIFIGLFVAACSDSDDNGDGAGKKSEVSFTTEVQTRALPNVITMLENGDAMTVFMAENNTIGTAQQSRHAQFSCQNNVWKGTPSVVLESGEKTYLYAVYPYQETVDKPDAIPVELGSQTDYLYSGNGVAASYEQPNVKLTMKHALSVLAFNIRNDNYGGEGKLQKISISGKPVYTSGTLNVSSGTIKGEVSGMYSQSCDIDIQTNGWEENLPGFFCIPLSSSGTNVTLSFKIDGDEYACMLPKSGIGGGIKYIFYLSLTEQGLRIFPEQTKQISLNTNSDSMVIPGYSLLKITHDNNFFTLPSLKGEGVVGTVLWGDGLDEDYGASSEHLYENAQTHTVVMETWGTKEISLPNLVGVSEIDLSEF